MRTAVALLVAWTAASFLARGAFGDLLRIGGVAPDLLTLVVVFWALALGPVGGTVAGFVVGLVADADLGRGLGVQAGALSLVGFFVGQAGLHLVKENLVMQAVLVAASVLFLAAVRLVLVAGGDPGALFSGALLLVAGEVLYTALLGPALYFLVRILGLPDPLRHAAQQE